MTKAKKQILIPISQNSSNTIELVWKFETQHEVQVLSSPKLPSTVYFDFRPPTSKANQLKGNNHHNKQVERLLVDHDIMCVKGKRFCFKGTFSSPRGDYCASIHVSFDELKHPFDFDVKCQEHPTLISKEMCPCKCLLNMNFEIRSWIKCWPCDDDWNLFPVVYCGQVAMDTVKDANDFLLSVPKYVDNFSPGSACDRIQNLEAPPKYKNHISGPRHRSNGEINTSARKRPMHKREGGRQWRTSSPMATVNKNCRKPMSGTFSSYHTIVNHHTEKKVDSAMPAIIDVHATGSIYYGDEQFVSKHYPPPDENVTVFRGKTKTNSCPLVTLVGLAKTWEDKDVLCVFHRVAHVKDKS